MAYIVPARGAADWDTSLQTLFNQINADIASAGTGTAKVIVGTRAERVAYATPYDGLLWSESDYNAVWRYEATGAVWQRASGAKEYAPTLYGTAEVGTEQVFWIVGEACTISTVQIKCKTAPTGADIIVDIKINGTSIYASTPANRPTIAATATTGSAGDPDTTAVAAGDRLSVEYAQIGSGTAGADTMLNIQVQ